MNEIIKSSKDPKQVSRTIKGGVITVLGAIISIAVTFGVDASVLPSGGEIKEIAQIVGEIAGAGSIIVGGVIHLYGIIAKVVNSVTELKI